MKTKSPSFSWGHAIMYIAALVCIRLTTYHEYSPSQLVLEKQPNISHLQIFGCAIYMHQLHLHNALKWVPNENVLKIYVGFDSPYIIKYLKPLTGNVFTTRFVDYQF